MQYTFMFLRILQHVDEKQTKTSVQLTLTLRATSATEVAT